MDTFRSLFYFNTPLVQTKVISMALLEILRSGRAGKDFAAVMFLDLVFNASLKLEPIQDVLDIVIGN